MTPSKVASYFFHVYYSSLCNTFKPVEKQDHDIPALADFYGEESTVAFAHADDKQTNSIGGTSIIKALRTLLEETIGVGSVTDFKVELERAYFVRSRSGSVVASSEGVLLFPNAEVPFNQTFHLVPTPQRPETYYVSAECFHVHPTKKCAAPEAEKPAAAAATKPAATATAAAPAVEKATTAPATAATEKPHHATKKAHHQKEEKTAATTESTKPAAAAATAAPTPAPAAKPAAKRSLKEALTAPVPEKQQQQQAVVVVSSEEPVKQQRERRQPAGKRAVAAAAPAAEKKEEQTAEGAAATAPAAKPRGKRQPLPAGAEKPAGELRERRPRREQQQEGEATGAAATTRQPRPKRAPKEATATEGAAPAPATTSAAPAPAAAASASGYVLLDGTNPKMDFRDVRLAVTGMGFTPQRCVFVNNGTQVAVEVASADEARRLHGRNNFLLKDNTVLTVKKFTRADFEKVAPNKK